MRLKKMQITSIAMEIPALETDKEGKLRGGFGVLVSTNTRNSGGRNDDCNCNCSCGSNGNCNCNCGCMTDDNCGGKCTPSSGTPGSTPNSGSSASSIGVAYFMF